MVLEGHDGESAIRPRHACALGLCAALVYLALGQSTLFGDGSVFLLRTQSGPYEQRNHPLALPAMVGFGRAVQAFGASQYVGYRAFSQVGTALGVALLALALGRAGLDRRRAVAATLIVACSPSLVFFGTVVELHGPFFAVIGACAWGMACCVERPVASRVVVAGAASGLSHLMHASGILLGVVLAAWLFACLRSRAQDWRVAWRPAVLLLAVHVFVAATTRWYYEATYDGPTGNSSAQFVAGHAALALRDPQGIARTVWHEWIWAFLPLSLLWIAGLWRRRRAPGQALLLVVVATYLGASFLLLRGEQDEHGAYLAPVACFAAWVAARAWSGRVLIGAGVVALVIAAVQVRLHDEPERTRQFVAGARAAAAGRPFGVLIGDARDVEACFVGLPDQMFVLLPDPPLFTAPEHTVAALARYRSEALGSDGVLLLTDGAERWLRDPEVQEHFPGAVVGLRLLRQAFAWRRVDEAGFRGFELAAPSGR